MAFGGLGTSVNPTLVRLTDTSVRPTYCGSTVPSHQLLLSLQFPVLNRAGTGHASALLSVGNTTPHYIRLFSYKDSPWLNQPKEIRIANNIGWNMYSTGICRGTERRKCHLRPLSLHVHADSLHAHMRMQGGGQTERDTHTVPTSAFRRLRFRRHRLVRTILVCHLRALAVG